MPAVPPRKRDEALAKLTQRYFAGHGPATLYDFAWWSGLTVADARLGIAMNEAHLASETLDGKRYWFDSSAAIEQADRSVVHLLPNFDEHLVAYWDHGPSIDPALSATLDPNRLLFVSHTVVRDGLVVGTWRVSMPNAARP